MLRVVVVTLAAMGGLLVGVVRRALDNGYVHYAPKVARAAISLAATPLPGTQRRQRRAEWGVELELAERLGHDALAWALGVLLHSPALAVISWTSVALGGWPWYRWAYLGGLGSWCFFQLGYPMGPALAAVAVVPYFWTWDWAVGKGVRTCPVIAERMAGGSPWTVIPETIVAATVVVSLLVLAGAAALSSVAVRSEQWLLVLMGSWLLVIGAGTGVALGFLAGLHRQARQLREGLRSPPR